MKKCTTPSIEFTTGNVVSFDLVYPLETEAAIVVRFGAVLLWEMDSILESMASPAQH